MNKKKLFCTMILLVCGFIFMAKSQQASVSDKREIYIVGDVVKPSILAFTEGITLTQAIKEAGGVLPDKKDRIVTIHRVIPDTKQREIIKVDLKAIQKNKINDFLIKPLDIVLVELRKKKTNKRIDHIEILTSDKSTVLTKTPT